MPRHLIALALLAAAPLALAGCGGDDDGDGDGNVSASGATCPPNSTLTYANFGQDFMRSYCTECHSASKTGPARIDAPVGVNYDSVADVRTHSDHIDEFAAAGPTRTNRTMPPQGMPDPTDEQRRQLGEWLACGAP